MITDEKLKELTDQANTKEAQEELRKFLIRVGLDQNWISTFIECEDGSLFPLKITQNENGEVHVTRHDQEYEQKMLGVIRETNNFKEYEQKMLRVIRETNNFKGSSEFQ